MPIPKGRFEVDYFVPYFGYIDNSDNFVPYLPVFIPNTFFDSNGVFNFSIGQKVLVSEGYTIPIYNSLVSSSDPLAHYQLCAYLILQKKGDHSNKLLSDFTGCVHFSFPFWYIYCCGVIGSSSDRTGFDYTFDTSKQVGRRLIAPTLDIPMYLEKGKFESFFNLEAYLASHSSLYYQADEDITLWKFVIPFSDPKTLINCVLSTKLQNTDIVRDFPYLGGVYAYPYNSMFSDEDFFFESVGIAIEGEGGSYSASNFTFSEGNESYNIDYLKRVDLSVFTPVTIKTGSKDPAVTVERYFTLQNIGKDLNVFHTPLYTGDESYTIHEYYFANMVDSNYRSMARNDGWEFDFEAKHNKYNTIISKPISQLFNDSISGQGLQYSYFRFHPAFKMFDIACSNITDTYLPISSSKNIGETVDNVVQLVNLEGDRTFFDGIPNITSIDDSRMGMNFNFSMIDITEFDYNGNPMFKGNFDSVPRLLPFYSNFYSGGGSIEIKPFASVSYTYPSVWAGELAYVTGVLADGWTGNQSSQYWGGVYGGYGKYVVARIYNLFHGFDLSQFYDFSSTYCRNVIAYQDFQNDASGGYYTWGDTTGFYLSDNFMRMATSMDTGGLDSSNDIGIVCERGEVNHVMLQMSQYRPTDTFYIRDSRLSKIQYDSFAIMFPSYFNSPSWYASSASNYAIPYPIGSGETGSWETRTVEGLSSSSDIVSGQLAFRAYIHIPSNLGGLAGLLKQYGYTNDFSTRYIRLFSFSQDLEGKDINPVFTSAKDNIHKCFIGVPSIGGKVYSPSIQYNTIQRVTDPVVGLSYVISNTVRKGFEQFVGVFTSSVISLRIRTNWS